MNYYSIISFQKTIQMLRFHHFPTITSTVQHGKKLWRTIAFPTLNLSATSSLSSWTYKVRISIDNKFFSWMGAYFADRNHCEVHAFGMTWDQRYGMETTVTFLHKMRENIVFESVEKLQLQLQKDMKRCYEHMRTVCTFWSFDVMHPGHEHYLTFAKQQGDFLTTIVASDHSITTFKKHHPTFSQHQRIEHIEALGLVDTIVPWDPTNHFAYLGSYTPEVLVFWYDQHTRGVEQRYQDQQFSTPFFVQAPSHYPDRYKSSLIKLSQQ